VKELLSQKGIEFTEIDISKDKTAIRQLEELGVMTTPVTLVDGEIVIGLDKPKLEELLSS